MRAVSIVPWRPYPMLGQQAPVSVSMPPASMEPVPVIDSTAMRFVTDGVASVASGVIAFRQKNPYVKGAMWSLAGLTGLMSAIELYRLVR